MNSRIPDAHVADLNRYMGRLDREEARADAIDRRTAALMTIDGGFSPADIANVSEAIGELVANERYADRLALIADRVDKVLAAAGQDTGAHHQMIGLHLVGFLKDYWTRYAKNRAETEIDDSCPHCFGKGCRKCEAPERD